MFEKIKNHAKAEVAYAKIRDAIIKAETFEAFQDHIKEGAHDFMATTPMLLVVEDEEDIFVSGGLSFSGLVTLGAGIMDKLESLASQSRMLAHPVGEA